MAEASESIAERFSISAFFLIFTLVPILAGLIILSLDKFLRNRMHGVE